MAKRIGFVAMVFTIDPAYTQGMVLALMHIYIVELLAILKFKPFVDLYHLKMEVFNGVTAYLFLMVIQIFNEQHPQDFSEEDKTVEDQD